jgi:hypothetical protein
MEKITIAVHLSEFREGLVADGYDLLVDGFAAGTAHLRIIAGPEACAECLVPKKLMTGMLEESLKDLPEVLKVEVTYPADSGGA